MNSGSPIRALVVDDEPSVRRFLKASLSARGYEVSEAATGQEAVELIANSRPEVILLDLGLPDLSGIEVTRIVREWCSVPIIVLSVRDRESDKVEALEAGADDYLTKPFGLNELNARLRAALRRVQKTVDEPLVITGWLRIDLANRQVTRQGQIVALTPTEYDIIRVLARHRGKVLTHRRLIQEVWGHIEQDLHTVRVNISNLRRKIEESPAKPQLLVTEPGVGYRLQELDPV